MSRRKRRTSIANDPNRAVGYIRCSRDHQELGPEAQHAALDEWCRERGIQLVAIYQEQISGAAPLDTRLRLLAAVDALTELNAGVLLVHRRDRLARDSVAAAMIDRLVQRNGGDVVATVGVGNGEGPEAELMRGVIDLFAQFERQIIRARTKAGLAVKKSRGERVGRIPFGYGLADDGVHLRPDPTETRAINLVETLREEGLTQQQIADSLNARGLYSRGRKGLPAPWHQTSVGRLLRRSARQRTTPGTKASTA